MTKLLLSLHVLAAIVAIGPVTVAASMFPAAVRRSAAPAVPALLHRICRVYAGLGLLVPVFGLATASSLGVLTDAWLIISMILTAVAGIVLAFAILPGQAAALTAQAENAAAPDDKAAPPDDKAAPPDDKAAPRGRAAALTKPRDKVGISGKATARLGMVTGVFNLLWAIVVVLMIVRPGSTTGA
ncbi:DUF2269 family protein [Actinoplanes sp. NPDC049316]|uniref:DUF2269 family protein n=1 Tax=Actinoplanes sp. NPDC049316 TaxID=3154727 RepID=UPI00343E9788